jgi:hypothetical protein
VRWQGLFVASGDISTLQHSRKVAAEQSWNSAKICPAELLSAICAAA